MVKLWEKAKSDSLSIWLQEESAVETKQDRTNGIMKKTINFRTMWIGQEEKEEEEEEEEDDEKSLLIDVDGVGPNPCLWASCVIRTDTQMVMFAAFWFFIIRKHKEEDGDDEGGEGNQNGVMSQSEFRSLGIHGSDHPLTMKLQKWRERERVGDDVGKLEEI